MTSALSHVEQRRVTQDYTFSYYGKKHLIAPQSIQPGLRGGTVRVERRLDGSLAVNFKDKWLQTAECPVPTKVVSGQKKKTSAAAAKPRVSTAERTKAWRESGHDLFRGGLSVSAAAEINRTRTEFRRKP